MSHACVECQPTSGELTEARAQPGIREPFNRLALQDMSDSYDPTDLIECIEVEPQGIARPQVSPCDDADELRPLGGCNPACLLECLLVPAVGLHEHHTIDAPTVAIDVVR